MFVYVYRHSYCAATYVHGIDDDLWTPVVGHKSFGHLFSEKRNTGEGIYYFP